MRVPFVLLAVLSLVAPCTAWPSDRSVDDSRVNRSRIERDNERQQRQYENWQRQQAREKADAAQGGRSGPNAIGDQPYKNPKREPTRSDVPKNSPWR